MQKETVTKSAVKKAAAAVLSLCLLVCMTPLTAFADDGSEASATSWKDLYESLIPGFSASTDAGYYDTVTSATYISANHHVGHIPSVVQKEETDFTFTKNNTEYKELVLTGVKLSGAAEAKETTLLSGTHATFEGKTEAKTYGTDEFLIALDYTDKDYTWSDYLDKIYAVTISDGTTTVGAVPWIDWYGEKATSGPHYNKVEIALNSGTVVADNKATVHRFDAFYDENGELKTGKYTVTVYADGFETLIADNIYVPKRANATLSFGSATATTVETALTNLPDDFQPVYTVDGNPATYDSGVLSFDAVKPGNHTVIAASGNLDADGNKKYGDVTGTFTYAVDFAAAEYDADSKTLAATADAAAAGITAEDYIAAITKVNVDGKDYGASGRGAVKVINNDGSIDLSKTSAAGTKAAVPFTVTATGYPEYSFVYTGTIDDEAEVSVDDQTYTGSAVTPDVKVAVSGVELTEGTDYTAEYADNTNAGTATVKITGIGNYSGTVEKTFKIVPAEFKNAVVTASAQTYTGKALTPAVTVKLAGKTLVKDKDYTVAYSANKNAGTAKVTVTGKGSYTGTASGTFKIKKAAQKMTAKAKVVQLKAKKLKKKAQKVKIAKAVKVSGAEGKVTYKLVKVKKAKFKKYFKVNAKNGKITVKKKLKKGTYNVTVKVTSAATSNYNAASKNVTFKVKVK